jgi:hypothetical protein
MPDSRVLRAAAVLLMSVLGVVDLSYGFLYAGGNYENIWYVMGAIYFLLAGIMALEIELWLFEPIILGYSLFLFFAWLTSGVSRDPIAYADKALELVLAVSMVQLIRNRTPATRSLSSGVP